MSKVILAWLVLGLLIALYDATQWKITERGWMWLEYIIVVVITILFAPGLLLIRLIKHGKRKPS